ncbi:putative quinol monooxygenase [Sphingobium sp. Sx8-8]|uniref:putative quinol monooxygenase n=1 Tax=Sphingobium sp. Sx8-8 TaxID=2933617 RepID=UPI001F593B44|nr:putative quinol monooxygenase [Sphingobium sp. Sx8-8]
MTINVKTVGILTAHPGKEAELCNLLAGLIGPSRSEPGNLRYDLWADPSEPGVFVLDELYVDADAAAAHQASPHFLHYRANVGALADRRALSLQAVVVA